MSRTSTATKQLLKQRARILGDILKMRQQLRQLEEQLDSLATQAASVSLLPASFRAKPSADGRMRPLWVAEREFRFAYLGKAVDACRGNVKLAARMIGISLATAYRLLEKMEDDRQ